MSYFEIIKILKGSDRSGNYGHQGRPGSVGGSRPGGGHGAIGIRAEDNADTATIKRRAYMARTGKNFKTATSTYMAELDKYYNLGNKCGNTIDCSSLVNYTSTGHDKMNQYLRKLPGYDKIEPLSMQNRIKAIDRVFEDAPTTPVALKAFRGVHASALRGLQPGDEFQDNGFVSTSLDYDSSFSGAKLEIRVPKGSKAVFVRAISSVGGEQELLLDRGQKFRLLHAEYKTYHDGSLVKDDTGHPVIKSGVLELIND